MGSVTTAFGSMICNAIQFVGIVAPRCYSPPDLAFIGSMFMTFLAVLTMGWRAARQV